MERNEITYFLSTLQPEAIDSPSLVERCIASYHLFDCDDLYSRFISVNLL